MKFIMDGQIGIAEGASLVFILLMPRMFLSAITTVLPETQQLVWLGLLINHVGPLLAIFAFGYASRNIQLDFISQCRELFGRTAGTLVVLFFAVLFLVNSSLLLRQFAENTLLTALPEIEYSLVNLLYAGTIAFLCWGGIISLGRIANILLPIVISGVIAIILLIYPFYLFQHLFPWQGNGFGPVILVGFSGTGFNLGILAVFILASFFGSQSKVKKAALIGLSGSVVLKIVYYTVYILVFGVKVGSERIMPFYELARLVYIDRFFQRIESLFIIVWVLSGVLALAISFYVAVYLLSRLFSLSDIRPLIGPLIIICAIASSFPESIVTTIELDAAFNRVASFGIYLYCVLFPVACWIYKKRRKCLRRAV